MYERAERCVRGKRGIQTLYDLVVEHYRENRNISYYAKLMDYDPRYFSKVFRLHNNFRSGSPHPKTAS